MNAAKNAILTAENFFKVGNTIRLDSAHLHLKVHFPKNQHWSIANKLPWRASLSFSKISEWTLGINFYEVLCPKMKNHGCRQSFLTQSCWHSSGKHRHALRAEVLELRESFPHNSQDATNAKKRGHESTHWKKGDTCWKQKCFLLHIQNITDSND